jgi:hypothetical protein
MLFALQLPVLGVVAQMIPSEVGTTTTTTTTTTAQRPHEHLLNRNASDPVANCAGCFVCDRDRRKVPCTAPLRGPPIRWQSAEDKAFCEADRETYGQYATPGAKPLWGSPNNQGWGNRVGWYLTMAAIGKALKRPVYTYWDTGNQKWGEYSATDIDEICEWPPSLHWVWDNKWRQDQHSHKEYQHTPVPGDMLPTDLPEYAGRHVMRELVPELAYDTWKLWTDKKPELNFTGRETVTLKAFLEAYQRVYFEHRPKVDLGNPPKLQYLVLHLRGFDKINTNEKRTAMSHSLDIVKNKMLPHITSNLSWVVVANTPGLQHQGENVIRAAGRQIAKRPGPKKKTNTYQLLSDFFAMKYAAGVVVGMQKWSSFSTSGILAGDRPILYEFPFKLNTEGGNGGQHEVRSWEVRVGRMAAQVGFGGATTTASGQQPEEPMPLRNIFSIDDVPAFNRALNNQSAPRYRHGVEPSWAPDPRLQRCFEADYNTHSPSAFYF